MPSTTQRLEALSFLFHQHDILKRLDVIRQFDESGANGSEQPGSRRLACGDLSMCSTYFLSQNFLW